MHFNVEMSTKCCFNKRVRWILVKCTHHLARCNASSSYQFTLPNCLLIKLLKCCLSCSAVVAVVLVVQIGWMLWMLPTIVNVPQLLWSSCGDWWATTYHHLLPSSINQIIKVRRARLDKIILYSFKTTNTNLINDIMFTNSFEKYHLERAVSVEPIGKTDTALKRWYLKKCIETVGRNTFLIKISYH